ncbi:MAG: YdcF family protein [Corallococcus sp.]|nr:YdcF family protein [Corallococcus sp.]MCM1359293.1 YdcF family protein [Corallococcus sp.]MCM1394685.1 YdcF family protein [Corallococcus sp.]
MKVAVILGNRLNDDASITAVMEERLMLAMQLITEYSPDKIIVSGGVANPAAGVSEAQVMKDWLVMHGIDKDLIVQEDKSLTTKQNAKYAVPIIVGIGAKNVFLCTSQEHMKRWYLNPVKLFRKRLKKYPNIQVQPYCKNVKI